MSSNLENLAVATGLERSIFILIPKKGNAKECSNYHIIALISHASKIMSKGFKLGFISTWTKNIQMYKLDFENAEEPEIKLLTLIGSWRKQRSSRKTSTFFPLITLFITVSMTMLLTTLFIHCFIDYTKAFDHVDQPIKINK